MKYSFINSMLLVFLLVTLAACSKPESTPTEESAGSPETGVAANSSAQDAANLITADYLREIIVEISDDKYEGRGPGTPGDAAARKYLAESMDSLGILPGAADGSWEQPFDLIGVNASQPDALRRYWPWLFLLVAIY